MPLRRERRLAETGSIDTYRFNQARSGHGKGNEGVRGIEGVREMGSETESENEGGAENAEIGKTEKLKSGAEFLNREGTRSRKEKGRWAVDGKRGTVGGGR
jgi:hypothetical protein